MQLKRKGRRRLKLPEGELADSFMTVREAAESLDVTTSTIYYYIRSRVLESDESFGITLVKKSSLDTLSSTYLRV